VRCRCFTTVNLTLASMTLKFEGGRDILIDTEYEAASIRYSKLRA